MKEAVIIEAHREGYAINQCYKTMTVGELIKNLSQYDEDTPIYFSDDNRYYGSLKEENIDIRYEDEGEDISEEGE